MVIAVKPWVITRPAQADNMSARCCPTVNPIFRGLAVLTILTITGHPLFKSDVFGCSLSCELLNELYEEMQPWINE